MKASYYSEHRLVSLLKELITDRHTCWMLSRTKMHGDDDFTAECPGLLTFRVNFSTPSITLTTKSGGVFRVIGNPVLKQELSESLLPLLLLRLNRGFEAIEQLMLEKQIEEERTLSYIDSIPHPTIDFPPRRTHVNT